MAAYGDDNKVEVSEGKMEFSEFSEGKIDVYEVSEGKLDVFEAERDEGTKAERDAIYEEFGLKKPDGEAGMAALNRLFAVERDVHEAMLDLNRSLKERLAAVEPLRRQNEAMELKIFNLEAEIRGWNETLSVLALTPSKRPHEDDGQGSRAF